MPDPSRRQFLAGSVAAAVALRTAPAALRAVKERRVLTLVYDKALGMMRAVDRVVR